jgi:dTDP-glucose 4,6-dehydratase
LKKILVTGGAGFIGSHFIKYALAKNPDLHIINLDLLTYAGNLENLAELNNLDSRGTDQHKNSRYTFVKGDIRNHELTTKVASDCDAIVNFAAESHVDRSITGPEAFVQTNVLGTLNLLETARKINSTNSNSNNDGAQNQNTSNQNTDANNTNNTGNAPKLNASKSNNYHQQKIRFVQISTDEVYGSLGETGSFSETTPIAPNSPYSASKAAADLLCRSYFHTFNMDVMITRCSNNYGPNQFPEKLIPLMINNAKNGKSLPVYGDGLNVRDWIYVEDHCSAIYSVLEKGKSGEVYNIGSDNEWPNIQIVKKIIQLVSENNIRPADLATNIFAGNSISSDNLCSEKLITYVTDRPGHDRRYSIDSSKIKSELSWHPQTSFDIGLKKTVDWYLNSKAWLDHVTTGEYKKYYDQQYVNR